MAGQNDLEGHILRIGQTFEMKIRKRIPSSQLINDSGGLVRPVWLLAGLCLAGAAEAIGPPFEVFYPPSAEPFGAGWSLARFLASSWAAVLVFFMLGGGILGELKRPSSSIVVESGCAAGR